MKNEQDGKQLEQATETEGNIVDDGLILLDKYKFQYNFANAPLFFTQPRDFDKIQFDVKFHQAMYSTAQYLRKHPDTSPDAVAAPDLYGMTFGEMAILHLLARHTQRKLRTMKRKKEQNQGEESSEKKTTDLEEQKKFRTISTKLKQRSLLQQQQKEKKIIKQEHSFKKEKSG